MKEMKQMNNELSVLSILVIEDEYDIRKKIVEYLKLDYKNVYEASDAEDGYRVYKEKKPDILMIDINLGKMNGLELLKEIRKDDHSTKAIVITAYSEVDYLLKATELKLTKYLVKPVSRKQMREALDSVNKEMEIYDVKKINSIKLNDDYVWNSDKEELYCKNTIVQLNSKESILLNLLLSKVNQPFSYDYISNEIWDYPPTNKINSIKLIVKKLRKKLPKNIIQNIYGHGYKIIK